MGQACCAERDYLQNREYMAASPHTNISSPRHLQSIDPLIIMKLNQLPPYKFTTVGIDRGIVRDVQKLPNIDCYYKGEWKDGKLHGIGSMYFPDGSIYTGSFQNN